MKIEFETGNLTEQEASGLVALLQALHGSTAVQVSHEHITGSAGVIGAVEETRPRADFTLASGDPDPMPVAGDEPETDADGLPWDERIHASTRSTKADGTWTRRRGVSDETYDAVMAELRASVAASADEAMPETAGVDWATHTPLVLQAPAPEPDSAAQAFAPAVPTPPAPPVPVPAIPAPPTASGAPEFHELIKRVTPLQAAGKLDAAGVSSLLGAVGLKSIADLIKADDQTRQAFAAMLDTVQ